MIYLFDNPLLREPLKAEHVKNRLLGHFGTDPGQTFVWAHLNRLIALRSRRALRRRAGPRRARDACELVSRGRRIRKSIRTSRATIAGMLRFFRQFSFPGGIGSHCTPETPGSIHEGGELGYSLAHAFGAAFDNPNLIVAAVVGDGEAETGPLAASWHSNKFLNPIRDGAVLPICTSTATRSRTRRSWRASRTKNWTIAAARIRLDAALRRGLRSRRSCIAEMAADARALLRRHPRAINTRRRSRARRRARAGR
jgi:phosphoketolase